METLTKNVNILKNISLPMQLLEFCFFCINLLNLYETDKIRADRGFNGD